MATVSGSQGTRLIVVLMWMSLILIGALVHPVIGIITMMLAQLFVLFYVNGSLRGEKKEKW